MITLYHAPRSRSSRFIFLLEELGAPYEIKLVNIRRGDGSGEVDPVNPHPHGKVPVIKDGDAVVFESAAVALYLTDRFPQNGIGPLAGDSKRGAYLSWLAYYAGVMEPAWISAFRNWDVPRGTAGWVKTDEVMAFVNATLEKGLYLLGEKFSAADILVGTTFKLFMGSPLLAKTDLLEAYVQRVTERAAYARAQAKDNG
ncbi:MAG TPA: glutathione S-transferase family protein [Rhizomicrobium sp.]|jgi:glutathione S-transferase|nr:glutathione S-transferase family protein [Rhizomicrobium sp.]